MTRSQGEGPRHLAYVDSLRGIAIVGVVLVHAAQQVPSLPDVVGAACDRGKFGVQLFFVISAFTLFLSLENRSDLRPTAAFFTRRIFRIAPLFWLAAIAYFSFDFRWRSYFAPHGLSAVDLLCTLTFVHGWSPTTANAVVPGGWSIGAEAIFYLLVPLLHRWVRTPQAALWLVTVSSTIVHATSRYAVAWAETKWPDLPPGLAADYVYYSFPSQFPVFATGLSLYRFIVCRPETYSRRQTASASAALVFVGWLGMLQPHVMCGAMFALLAATLHRNPVRWLVNPVTAYLGSISFSIYLWHFAFLGISSWVVPSSIVGQSKAWGLVRLPLVIGAIAAMTLPAAHLSYHFVELAGIRAGKGLIKRMRWGRRETQPG